MAEILPRDHPSFEEFIKRLKSPEGCNIKEVNYKFVETTHESREIAYRYTWECNATADRPKATAILKTIPDIDVEGTLAYFDEHGGFCDCEVLFNIGNLNQK
jgi:hypothetical protein